ncbi:hypothetical protein BDF22DRAFT_683158 [Syncephalis plumigaleata]|nr:hypothetical protein BDF22DRAFT_683158 [Syncephalis plumigaleata]
MIWKKLTLITFLLLVTLQCVSAHMNPFSPICRGDKRNTEYKVPFYGIDAAIYGGKFDGKYPCRYQEEGPITGKYTAGKNFTVEFMQGSPHMGGHCQFAFSYDKGKTWVVLRTVITMCFQGKAPYLYNVFIPKGAPNGRALFAWTYIPSGGRKEYYMTCADVEVSGGSEKGSITGPELLLARMPGSVEWPSWQKKDGTKDGREKFNARKIVTIPPDASATEEGKVKGEAGGGKPGAIEPPMEIPWDTFIPSKFADNLGAKSVMRKGLGPDGKNLTKFFVATSEDYRGGTGDATKRSPSLEGGLPYSANGGGGDDDSGSSKAKKTNNGEKKSSKKKKTSSEDSNDSKEEDKSGKEDNNDSGETNNE